MRVTKINNFTFYNKLLILAIVISPFTDLRFTFFGLAELIIIVSFFNEFSFLIKNNIVKFRMFSKFWIIYLLVSFIGLSYNNYYLGFINSTIQNTFFDFFAYLVVLMSVFLFESLIYRNKINIHTFLKNIFIYFSLTLSFLYILSLYTSSIFGFSLLYYHYFVPLTNNLHQISMVLVPLPFIGLMILSNATNLKMKIIFITLIILDVVMLYNVGSDKAILGLYTAVYIYLIMKFLKIFKGRNKYLFFIILLLITAILLLSNFSWIKDIAISSFNEADRGGGRATLYSDALTIGLDSPLFGLGTGSHIPGIHNKLWDAHNTFITAFLQAGIVGLFLLSSLFIQILFKIKSNLFLLMSFSTILIYATGGDILRKPILWIYMILFYYYNKQVTKTTSE